MMESVPLALYIHIPWCLRKCPYCDFNSHQLQGSLPEQQLLQALETDLVADLPLISGRTLTTVFIGGGTPSLLSAEAVARLLLMLRRHCQLSPHAEITLEANPGALELGRLQGYADAGINRLSLGVQSFSADSLQALGRIHSPEEAKRAVEQAMVVGFNSVNLDLMYGLPGQQISGAMDDLNQATAFSVPHISWYQLTIEPNTMFYSQPPQLPHEDEIAAIEQAGRAALQAAGLLRYEISAYSKAGHQCRHNVNYWQFGDFAGIGPGAHGKFTTATGKVFRRWKFRQPTQYLKKELISLVAGQVEVCGQSLSQEYLLNGLRLVAGTSQNLYEQRTGMLSEQLNPWRQQNIDLGLLQPGKRLQATPLGLRFLDDLLACF